MVWYGVMGWGMVWCDSGLVVVVWCDGGVVVMVWCDGGVVRCDGGLVRCGVEDAKMQASSEISNRITMRMNQ